ncbi:hypothetical protein QR680_019220 [Steinernema hermaphroditum]|uniref:Uncharacterized protein n=1 Tax=Steinernema hermaphroditum TaxID=289476 RepID=A0AA39HMN3_9BILA|nr:hypothetical protein QR680_019220 [Steinernema hermaphroditum]
MVFPNCSGFVVTDALFVNDDSSRHLHLFDILRWIVKTARCSISSSATTLTNRVCPDLGCVILAMVNGSCFIAEEEHRMWQFLADQLKAGNKFAKHPKGYKIWGMYRRTYPLCPHTKGSLQTHFRRQLLPRIHEAQLTLPDLNTVIERLGIRLDEHQIQQYVYCCVPYPISSASVAVRLIVRMLFKGTLYPPAVITMK